MEAVAAPAGDAPKEVPVAVIAPLTEEQKAEAWQKFEAIIYSNLDRILEKRPAFPVTKFAKAILEDLNLDENGDPILKKKSKKKDKKKKEKKEKKDKKEKKGAAGEEAKEEEEPKKKKSKKDK